MKEKKRNEKRGIEGKERKRRNKEVREGKGGKKKEEIRKRRIEVG